MDPFGGDAAVLKVEQELEVTRGVRQLALHDHGSIRASFGVPFGCVRTRHHHQVAVVVFRIVVVVVVRIFRRGIDRVPEHFG